MTKSEIIRFLILRSIGNFLVLFSVFGVGATFGPTLYYEARFRILQARGVRYKIVSPLPTTEAQSQPVFPTVAPESGFGAVLASSKEQSLIPKDTDFSILILKIGANARVVSNVNPLDEKEFLPALQQGVAHAKGSVFPGMKGNIYLFSHSTDNFWNVGRYNAVFYLLKDLTIGDEIVVFFENVRHNYVVTESKVADADDVDYLTKSQQRDEETLILQTCWPPGTTWKRLFVIAKPK